MIYVTQQNSTWSDPATGLSYPTVIKWYKYQKKPAGKRKLYQGYPESQDIPENTTCSFYMIGQQTAPTEWIKKPVTFKIHYFVNLNQ